MQGHIKLWHKTWQIFRFSERRQAFFEGGGFSQMQKVGWMQYYQPGSWLSGTIGLYFTKKSPFFLRKHIQSLHDDRVRHNTCKICNNAETNAVLAVHIERKHRLNAFQALKEEIRKRGLYGFDKEKKIRAGYFIIKFRYWKYVNMEVEIYINEYNIEKQIKIGEFVQKRHKIRER